MSSLKEQTAQKHQQAEQTPFMKAVFKKTLPRSVWVEWTYWKSQFYQAIESKCDEGSLLNDIKDIIRYHKLTEDWITMGYKPSGHNPVLKSYIDYINTLTPEQAMSHLYTWHMGDMFGGQMIKRIVEGPHNSLEFTDTETLVAKVRTKLHPNMGPEAIVAFDWAIKMMNELYHE